MRCRFAPGLLLASLLLPSLLLPGALPGLGGQGLAANAPPGAKQVPQPVRDLVESEISKDFVLPQTTQWRFDFTAPYAGGGGFVVCGSANYQSAQRTYVGWHVFYAIVDNNKVKVWQMVDPSFDTSGQVAARFRLLCEATP